MRKFGIPKKLWIWAAIGACFTAPMPGCASEQPSQTVELQDRYDVMDTNHDGKVVLEEFTAANPNMNEQAFTIIDRDGDDGITRSEWIFFTENHGQGAKGAPMNNIPGDPMIPPPDSSDLPLVRPPLAQ